MPAQISRETRIYLALWRKALNQMPEPIVVKVPSKGAGMAIRQGLYRAIRPYRDGVQFDPELVTAGEQLVLINECVEGQWQIRFSPRLSLEVLDLELLGLEESDLFTPMEKMELETLKRLESETSPEHNPFYTRGE